MTLTFTDGTITTTSSEQTLFDITADAHFATHIFSHNMQSGDTVVYRVYVKDQNANTMRLYDAVTLTNAQSSPDGWISFLPAKQYKVTIQRTAGTDRAFTWLRAQSDTPISFTDGSITTTTSEQTIFDTTANRHFGAYIFLHNMAGGDTMVFRVYMKDQNGATMRQFDSASKSGAQSSPAYYVPFIATKEYKITVQKTAGTNRAITYLLCESQ